MSASSLRSRRVLRRCRQEGGVPQCTVHAANQRYELGLADPTASGDADIHIHPRAGSVEIDAHAALPPEYSAARALANRHDSHTPPRGVRASVADASLACSFSSHSRSAASERCSSTALACANTVRTFRCFPLLPLPPIPSLPPPPRESTPLPAPSPVCCASASCLSRSSSHAAASLSRHAAIVFHGDANSAHEAYVRSVVTA